MAQVDTKITFLTYEVSMQSSFFKHFLSYIDLKIILEFILTLLCVFRQRTIFVKANDWQVHMQWKKETGCIFLYTCIFFCAVTQPLYFILWVVCCIVLTCSLQLLAYFLCLHKCKAMQDACKYLLASRFIDSLMQLGNVNVFLPLQRHCCLSKALSTKSAKNCFKFQCI